MLKIGVLASGGGTNLQAVIDKIESGYIDAKIVGLVSNNRSAYALERAMRHGILTRVISKKQFSDLDAYENEMLTFFSSLDTELLITAGFMVVLSEKFISKFRNRMINIHPSLIPSFCGKGYYGLKVHEAALAKGVKVTGATVHFVDEGTDTGPIILQKPVLVHEYDTPETLQRRVMEEAEWVILPEAVKLFSENRLVIRDGKVWGDNGCGF